MVNLELEAEKFNITINIILVTILVDIGQFWFQKLTMIFIRTLVNIDRGDPVEFVWSSCQDPVEFRILSRSCRVPVEFRTLWRSCGVPFDIDIGLDIDHDIGRYSSNIWIIFQSSILKKQSCD